MLNKAQIILMVALSLLSFPLLSKNSQDGRYIPSKEDAKVAAKNYQEMNYGKAFSDFERLAYIGDKHAQYMLSIMFLYGQGTEKNPAKSYAWSKLSTETNSEPLISHFKKLTASLPQETIGQGEEVYSKIYKRYNDVAIAREYRSYFNDQIPTCTGSRIKGNCGNVQIACSDKGSLNTEKRCKKEALKYHPIYIAKMQENQKRVHKYIVNNAKTSVTVRQKSDNENKDTEK